MEKKTVAINVCAVIGVLSVATCVSTAVGILFEAGFDRLMLAIIALVSGIVAVLAFFAANRLARS